MEATPKAEALVNKAAAKVTPRRTGSAPRPAKLVITKKTPAMRKMSSRTISTPVQLNPAKLLKKNLKTKVETAITDKIAEKPNSSPYLLKDAVCFFVVIDNLHIFLITFNYDEFFNHG